MTAADQIVVPAPRRSGRPPLTSRPELLSAGLAHGFRGLTIGVVTEACGVKYATLYRHWSPPSCWSPGSGEIGLNERPVPDRDTWRDQLGDTADILRAVLTEWPGMADALARLPRPEWIGQARQRATDLMTVPCRASTEIAAQGVDTVLRLATLDPDTVPAGAVGFVLDGLAARGWPS